MAEYFLYLCLYTSETLGESKAESKAESSKQAASDDPDGVEAFDSYAFASISHKDAFLVFRALCKLSMKGLNESAHNEVGDQMALQNR